jgi:hypothetical protein
MDITFTDWETGEYDTGETFTLDWTSADTLRHAPLLPVIEALRQAVIERYRAAQWTVSSILKDPITPHTVNLYLVCSVIDFAIADLIPRFVNHTDNGGNWHGVSPLEIAPPWTESAICDAIGCASLDHVSQNTPPSPDWAIQCHSVLNLLRWTRRFDATITERRIRFGPAPENKDTVVAAVDSAIAAMADSGVLVWLPLGMTFDNNPGARTVTAIQRLSPPLYLGGAHCVEMKWQFADIYEDAKHTADLYAQTTLSFNGSFGGTYDAAGTGYLEGKYNLLQSFTAAAVNSRTSNRFGDVSLVPPKYPPGESFDAAGRGWSLGYPVMFFKLNVTDGFTFQ